LQNLLVILVFFLLSGCLNQKNIQNLKNDFKQEKQVKVVDKKFDKIKLDIPSNGMIFVKKNDNIYTIANKYQVIPFDIINDNNLSEPFNLKVNQVLFLRSKNIYFIKKDDSLKIISLRFAVNIDDLIKLNKLQKPYNLIEGNKIQIPINKNYSIIDNLLGQKQPIKNNNYIKEVYINTQLIKDAPKFIWPLKDKVIKKFGIFGRGQHYDGIDIVSKDNMPIYSSLDGKVAFVGKKIEKLGNLILIKHKYGWLTAYSNIGEIKVKEGDNVISGQIIAFTLKNAEKFHFQIRNKRKPLDPLKYLN
jgi:LysM repeat protein